MLCILCGLPLPNAEKLGVEELEVVLGKEVGQIVLAGLVAIDVSGEMLLKKGRKRRDVQHRRNGRISQYKAGRKESPYIESFGSPGLHTEEIIVKEPSNNLLRISKI
jgi:hypothetical protein